MAVVLLNISNTSNHLRLTIEIEIGFDLAIVIALVVIPNPSRDAQTADPR